MLSISQLEHENISNSTNEFKSEIELANIILVRLQTCSNNSQIWYENTCNLSPDVESNLEPENAILTTTADSTPSSVWLALEYLWNTLSFYLFSN